MIAIFYDRKNKREVTSEQLMPTKYVEYVATGDNDDLIPTGNRVHRESLEFFSKDEFESAKSSGHFNQFDNKDPKWEEQLEEKTPRIIYLREKLIADLCYKSENCPSHRNWDLYTTIENLLLLRLEPNGA